MTTASAETTADLEPSADLKGRAPGRPRSAKADEAIMSAVIDLLSEGQAGSALSMEAVAARAGVGKATIYRRWPNKEAMLIDAVRTMKGPPVRPPGESVRGDLIALASANRGKRMEAYGKVTACLLPDLLRDEELRAAFAAVMEPRRNLTREVLRRGIANGELRADLDVELSLLMLTAPIMVQNWLNWNPNVPHEGFAEVLVDAFLRGAAA
ncbi:TetR/AcrR family transcriptional regulator [Actinoplanes sp. NBRC 103695]|uniref:TetR/AcrR family transcriptional regulator n=1 Tax=Actinoplanes sp. NBRC 103695 TaxID=3032202 RepID=UPI0025530D7B|nr:TetR/AcrR family transcriptional regulator [Actinoplanes sp. NBRC 103695]